MGYFIIFMKETKGLSQVQIKKLYRKDMRDLDYGMQPTTADEDFWRLKKQQLNWFKKKRKEWAKQALYNS